jgi:hypothetical protein
VSTTSHVVIGLGPDTRIAVDALCPSQIEIGHPSGVFDVVLFASSAAELRRLAAAVTHAADRLEADAAETEAHDINRGFELARMLGMAPWFDADEIIGEVNELLDKPREPLHIVELVSHLGGRSWTGTCSCGSQHGLTDYEHIAAWRGFHEAANVAEVSL